MTAINEITQQIVAYWNQAWKKYLEKHEREYQELIHPAHYANSQHLYTLTSIGTDSEPV